MVLTSVFLTFGIFIVSLIILIKSSDKFTEAAEKIGQKLNINQFIIGVTILAIGTSLPELITSLIALKNKSTEIIIGNVIGSNIANILLVLGIIAIFSKKIKTKHTTPKIDIFVFFSTLIFITITFLDNYFTRLEGILGLFILLYYLLTLNSKNKNKNEKKKKKTSKKGLKLQFLIIFLSSFFIYLSAKYTIFAVINLSNIFNIGKEIIAISAVAIGTSLPELIVSLQATKKGNLGMAFGNVLGSNIFNTFAVLGIPALFKNLIIPQNIIYLSIPLLIFASLLFYFILKTKKLTKTLGYVMLIIYFLYLGKIFNFF